MSMSWRLVRTSGGAALAAALAAGVVASATGQTGRGPDAIALDVGRPGAPIPPTLFGVFFEDINFAADGGLYPERVINRSFEFTEPLRGWRKPWRPEADGELVVLAEGGLNENNPHYLRLRVYTPGRGFGVVNSGFRGMGTEAGVEYVFSAYVRSHPSGPRSLSARLTDERGQPLAEATLSGFSGEWRRYETTLQPKATQARAQLEIAATEARRHRSTGSTRSCRTRSISSSSPTARSTAAGAACARGWGTPRRST
jgi:alpha-N-arabinofuranosidase